ncbi:MAG TPA: PAS domain-containing protein, partial [Phenylobacterium sp.]
MSSSETGTPGVATLDLLETMSDGFYALGPDWRFTYVNPHVEAISGRSRAELLGRNVWEVFPHAVGSEFWQAHQDVMASRQPLQTVVLSVAVGRWVDARLRPTSDGGICILYRDVEEERLVKQQLDSTEAQLRLVMESVTDAFYALDSQDRFIVLNRACGDFLGLTRPEALGKNMWDLFPIARHSELETELAAVRRTGKPAVFEYPSRVRPGAVLEMRAAPMGDGGLAVTFTDITDRKQAEAARAALNESLERQVAERTDALAQSEQRFRGIFDAAFPSMALLAPDGEVLEVNRTALTWLGVDAQSMIGVCFWRCPPFAGNPQLEAAIEASVRTAATGDLVRTEHVLRGAEDTDTVVDFTIKPIHDAEGQVKWLVAEGRDISELKFAQEQLRQSQKMEAIGQLTGGIAHDFNNLLTIIRSSSDLLRRHDINPEKRRRYVDAISDTADRAAELTSQLLSFARRQALKPVVFDVRERVSEVARMVQSVVGARIQLDVQLTDQPCFAEADRSQFETALINMAVNARDAMDGEGRLSIGVRRAWHVPRTARANAADFIAVSVADTGSGIAPEQLERIFEPFFTTKDVGKGTGLGLSQVYGFAKQSGGEVAVDSRLGRGAVFTLYL